MRNLTLVVLVLVLVQLVCGAEYNNTSLNGTSATLVKTVKVNFTTANYPGGSEWNDFITISAESSLALKDSLGNSSGYTIYNMVAFTGTGNAGLVAGPYPENVNISFWAFPKGTTEIIEFKDLNNTHTYYLEFYGSRAATGDTRAVSVTIGSESDSYVITENTSDKAIFTSVSPSSGTIRASLTVSSGGYGMLNCIVLREYQSGTTLNPEIPAMNRNVQIYPIPFCDELRLSNLENIIRIELVNISGETLVVKQKPRIPEINIETKNMKSGVYILKLTDNTGAVSIHKVMK